MDTTLRRLLRHDRRRATADEERCDDGIGDAVARTLVKHGAGVVAVNLDRVEQHGRQWLARLPEVVVRPVDWWRPIHGHP